MYAQRARYSLASDVSAQVGQTGSAVEANRPRIYRFDDEMRTTPWIASQDCMDLELGHRFDDENDAYLVGEGTAEHDDAVGDEAVHESGVAEPPGLPLKGL